MNFSKGILEARKQHYGHLAKILVCENYFNMMVLPPAYSKAETNTSQYSHWDWAHPITAYPRDASGRQSLRRCSYVPNWGPREGDTLYWRYSRYFFIDFPFHEMREWFQDQHWHFHSAESWWISSLTRHPALVPYACGLKTLDNIYLDTTFAVKSNIYRHFPSKAEGIKELLEKLGRYSQDTIFYLRAWTFGYEEVWQALSAFLNSKVSWMPRID